MCGHISRTCTAVLRIFSGHSDGNHGHVEISVGIHEFLKVRFKKFEQNIKGFNEVGIPVGVYFYSYANSKESAIKDAEWVLEQIKGYEVELGVAYDWESWSFYNNFHQSFYSTTMNAKAFLDTVAKEGYKGLLYSSKNYLEKVWFPLDDYDVWLAHYTRETSYQGKYKYWQLASNGRVAGINGFVDVNIMYE